MLELIDKNFCGKYDYFYLPMDLKTQQSMGFAFINMLDPLFILDFYIQFNFIKWSDLVPNCNSSKHAQIVYANVQGLDDILKELKDKNVMKKNDDLIKPVIVKRDRLPNDQQMAAMLEEIGCRYK